MEVMLNQGAPAVIYDRPEEFSIKEAAQYLHISVGTLRRLLAINAIRFTKVSPKITRIKRADLDEYLSKNTK